MGVCRRPRVRLEGLQTGNTHLAGKIDLDGLDANVLGTSGHVEQAIGVFCGFVCWEAKDGDWEKGERRFWLGSWCLVLEGSFCLG